MLHRTARPRKFRAAPIRAFLPAAAIVKIRARLIAVPASPSPSFSPLSLPSIRERKRADARFRVNSILKSRRCAILCFQLIARFAEQRFTLPARYDQREQCRPPRSRIFSRRIATPVSLSMTNRDSLSLERGACELSRSMQIRRLTGAGS
jgi:hypothetical protein